jgi:Tol biopolymer transport system component
MWTSDLDGLEEANLTHRLGGLSCFPRFSPDGSMIAFLHSDPAEGQRPCDAGYHLWVMEADGTGAHRVTPEGSPATGHGPPSWSPDGSRILTYLVEPGVLDEELIGAVITDLWGQHMEMLPNVGREPAWSPDGTRIVSCTEARGVVHGRPGAWRRLLLTDADGSHPTTLVEMFVADADLNAQHDRWRDEMSEIGPNWDWVMDISRWVGPLGPVWSPDGDQIAFVAAIPFDPDGPWFKDQDDVWIYDLKTEQLIRLTHDTIHQGRIIWK